jgi:hypothetical protein
MKHIGVAKKHLMHSNNGNTEIGTSHVCDFRSHGRLSFHFCSDDTNSRNKSGEGVEQGDMWGSR